MSSNDRMLYARDEREKRKDGVKLENEARTKRTERLGIAAACLFPPAFERPRKSMTLGGRKGN